MKKIALLEKPVPAKKKKPKTGKKKAKETAKVKKSDKKPRRKKKITNKQKRGKDAGSGPEKKIRQSRETRTSRGSEKTSESVSTQMSRRDELLSMREFKEALVHEDILNEKKVILPFLKYLENKEIFSHYFEEDFDSSSGKSKKNKIKTTHGEIFHFLLLTNKFMSSEFSK